MSKIKSFDRPTVRKLREDVDEALATVAKKYGIAINTGNARFTGQKVSFKVEARTNAAPDETAEAADFRSHAVLWGLEANDLGRQFNHRGTLFTIIGAKPSSRKYPILGQNSNGTTYKFPAEDVKRGLVTKKAA